MTTVSPLLPSATPTLTPLACCGSVRTLLVGPLALALDALLVHYSDNPRTMCPTPAPDDVTYGVVCALCGAFVGWQA